MYTSFKKCGPNQYVPSCRPCNVTCTDRKICSFICNHNTQCYCRPGYLKKNGVCYNLRRSQQDMHNAVYSRLWMLLPTWIPEEKRCLCANIAMLTIIYLR
nr:unnamed protein product [Callosobruchus analis]